jgi:hypothetical protein
MSSKEFEMKLQNAFGWMLAALGAGILVSVTLLPQARGELVYDEEVVTAVPQAPAGEVRAEDRATFRQALSASHKAQTTLSAEAKAQRPAAAATVQVARPAQPTVVQVQPVVVAPAAAPIAVGAAAVDPLAAPATTDIQNLSKTDLMRRERVREELKNEDVLQERLEELRLRDERKRTEQLLGGKTVTTVNTESPMPLVAPIGTVAPVGTAQMVPVQEEMIVAPVAERPGQAQVLPVAPAPAQVVAVPAQPQAVAAAPQTVAGVDAGGVSQATAPAVADSDKVRFIMRPYAGVSNINVNNLFDVRPHYAAGIGLGIGASDNLTFEVGYTFNDYGISLASTNPWVAMYQNQLAMTGRAGALETLTMKQNVVDAGLKLFFLPPEARLRPFLGGGAAYSKSFVNYGQSYLTYLDQSGLQSLSRDFEMSSYLGYLSTGLDVRVNKSISIGAMFKYYTVLSSNESQGLDYQGWAPYYYNAYGGADYDKTNAGSSLAQSAFYTITGGASFAF